MALLPGLLPWCAGKMSAGYAAPGESPEPGYGEIGLH